MLLGFLKPTKGKIKYNDINIFENLRTWRDNIGFVPQEIFLFDGSILNILLHIGENKIDNQKLESALINSNLQSFIKTYLRDLIQISENLVIKFRVDKNNVSVLPEQFLIIKY